tara:strand:- start:1118 stop:2239 length:1122 start_codon:yes stop_codon:yes gene_type:complete
MKSNSFLYCKKCHTPNTRPRIKFDNEGVCNACRFHENRNAKINFSERKKELTELCNKYRSKNGEYDCIVPWSGGKDSSAIAYKLKFEHQMNPLLVTFSPIIGSKTGLHNRKGFRSLGFDNVLIAPDIKISKYLSKRFFIERGDPKIHWTAGIKSSPIKTAIDKNIKLIFYAENGECFYGGNVLHKDAEKKTYLQDIVENKIGDHPLNWVDENISKKDLNPYLLPDENEIINSKIEIYYFAYFEKWNVEENFNYISSKFNFLCHEDGRSPGTFTNFDSLDDHVDQVYYYLQLLKFGFGRATRDASRLIQQSNKNYEDLKDKIKKFDREVPTSDILKYCNFISLNIDEFNKICDKHRDKELWQFSGNNWKLFNEK